MMRLAFLDGRVRALGWAALVVVAACGKSGGSATTPPPLMTGWGNATVLDGGGVLSYLLTVDQGDLDSLYAKPAEETYVPADLTVGGESVGTVGLSLAGADEIQACFQGGQRVCPKVSYKIRFDFVDPMGQLRGLRALDFDAMATDPSLLHARLAAKLWNDMQVTAPRAVHAFITINGVRQGLYAATEDVDAIFTANRFPTAPSNNLYKDAWPDDADPADYTFALKTNTAKADNTAMAGFAVALMTGKPTDWAPALDHWAGLDYLMRYLAVDQAITNYTGFAAFYCDATGHNCSNHNFYWYQSGPQHFALIPWDFGDSFALRSPLAAVPGWDSPTPLCNMRVSTEGSLIQAPGCDIVFEALHAAGRPAYLKAVDQLLATWDVGALAAQIDDWAGEIAGAVAADPNGPTVNAWKAAVASLKRDVGALRERLEAVKAGAVVTPFALTVPGTNDFETTSPLPFLLGSDTESNPRSGAYATLNQTAPLSGAADARLDFALSNESNSADTGGFSQWAQLTLATGAGPIALSGLQQVRLKLKADEIRTVRVSIESSAYPDTDSVRWGWDVLVDNGVSDHTLDVAMLQAVGDNGTAPLAQVLASVTGISIAPEARGRNGDGLLPAGASDTGFVEVDDLSIAANVP